MTMLNIKYGAATKIEISAKITVAAAMMSINFPQLQMQERLPSTRFPHTMIATKIRAITAVNSKMYLITGAAQSQGQNARARPAATAKTAPIIRPSNTQL